VHVSIVAIHNDTDYTFGIHHYTKQEHWDNLSVYLHCLVIRMSSVSVMKDSCRNKLFFWTSKPWKETQAGSDWKQYTSKIQHYIATIAKYARYYDNVYKTTDHIRVSNYVRWHLPCKTNLQYHICFNQSNWKMNHWMMISMVYRWVSLVGCVKWLRMQGVRFDSSVLPI